MSLFHLWVALGVTIFVALCVVAMFETKPSDSEEGADALGCFMGLLVVSAMLAGLVVAVVAVWRWA